MADKKLSSLTELAATPAVNDEIYIRDVSEAPSSESKRISIANLAGIIKDIFDAQTFLFATNDDDPEAKTRAEVLAILSGQAAAAFGWNGQNLTNTGTIQATNAVWWREHHYSIFSFSPGASGATETAPNANTLGGFQLDAVGEELFFNCHVHPDWSADSDVEVHVHWEVNVDNTGGADADTVDLRLIVRLKGEGETAIKTQTLEEATTVGKSARYKAFETVFSIDFDSGTDPVDAGDLISVTLNFETDTSEVDNIIVTHVMCRYKTKKVQNEV